MKDKPVKNAGGGKSPASTTAGDAVVAPPTTGFWIGRFLLYFGLAVAGCAADLLTKEWMFAWRGLPRRGNEWWLIDGYVGIETAVNHGALFGLGQGMTSVFVTLSFAAAVGIVVWLFVFGLARDRAVTAALGLITGGIFGNLYDRLGLWNAPPGLAHGVRDWILFRYGQHTWPNFNIADSLLVCGACFLVWHSFTQPDETKPAADHKPA